MLHDKGSLLRVFTQNIDSLESSAGIPPEKTVAAHGNFDAAHVVGSRRPVPIEDVERAVFGAQADWDALAERHGGQVKPAIVMFGEMLPKRFFERANEDLPSCTLLLIMGTSLVVQPFASLVQMVRPSCARVLINRERVGDSLGMMFGQKHGDNVRDVFHCADTDDAVHELAAVLGWSDELRAAQEAATAGAGVRQAG